MEITIIALGNCYQVDGIKFFSASTAQEALELFISLKNLRAEQINNITLIDSVGTRTENISKFIN